MARLETTVEIAASPAEVWAVLTDLSAYAEWNPFILEASGEVAVGERLEVRIRPVGGKAMTLRPRVREVTPNSSFSWLGHLWGVPRLFDGAHHFALEATATGTRLVQSEDFGGLLVPLTMKSIEGGSRAGFEAMNAALKARVEGRRGDPAASPGDVPALRADGLPRDR